MIAPFFHVLEENESRRRRQGQCSGFFPEINGIVILYFISGNLKERGCCANKGVYNVFT